MKAKNNQILKNDKKIASTLFSKAQILSFLAFLALEKQAEDSNQ